MTPHVMRSFGMKRARVSHLIRYELGIRGWSQAKVARSLGCSEASVSKAVNGLSNSEDVLKELRKIGVPEKYLFDPHAQSGCGAHPVNDQDVA